MINNKGGREKADKLNQNKGPALQRKDQSLKCKNMLMISKNSSEYQFHLTLQPEF